MSVHVSSSCTTSATISTANSVGPQRPSTCPSWAGLIGPRELKQRVHALGKDQEAGVVGTSALGLWPRTSRFRTAPPYSAQCTLSVTQLNASGDGLRHKTRTAGMNQARQTLAQAASEAGLLAICSKITCRSSGRCSTLCGASCAVADKAVVEFGIEWLVSFAHGPDEL